ncbi:hypothetical protein [Mucilaginibacter sp. SP1R1]|uniref:hypothetical protein n=1 Tax=Mucilaginibacter sp. SP1R1 TaxID=2723091 RepID=UPI00161D890F|nr:hypothetical protein [Mucilaginibacter sp. SP1R1]MBB6151553.1 hypothetical protein [Mucilaginibacter sp. SP1R1]
MSSVIINNIVQGIISGFIASGIFLIVLTFIKPKIVISVKIACQYVKINGKTERIYTFKIINKSAIFRLYDLKVNGFICETIPNINGSDIQFKAIDFKGDDQWVINRLNLKHILQNLRLNDKTLKSRTDYASQFSTSDNLKNLLNNNSFITFQVLARHSLTGFSTVRTMNYHHISKIEDGCFLSGNTCKIVPSPTENKTFTEE